MKYDFVASLQGNSGSSISVVKHNGQHKVLKQGHSEFSQHRTIFEELNTLGFNTPKVYTANSVHMTMDYIPGISIYAYLESYPIDYLLEFLISAFTTFDKHSTVYNFSKELDQKFDELECTLPPDIILPFELSELRLSIPDQMPQGPCHGDLTLENILFYQDKFYLIDCTHKLLNSWWLDSAKLCQDLDAHWFLRNHNPSLRLIEKLNTLSKELKNNIPIMNNTKLVCFQLLRILPYCRSDVDKKFIAGKIQSLWT